MQLFSELYDHLPNPSFYDSLRGLIFTLISEYFSHLNLAHIAYGQAEVLFSILRLGIILDTSAMFSLW